ncbi:M3 family oligoendopeptidase [Fredinandcohnia sp. 179-A 10B2 NHS]|uniref:M3 family oligoendopeptidase n=1 Tax=Fredinandcohnia sp. 179-A 10B2 NHS TaxID=3235176 RepID=UPI00399FD93B
MKFKDFTYERPSIENVKAQMKQLIKSFQEAANAEQQISTIKKINKFREEYDSAQMIAHIRHTLDTTDPFYEKEYEFFNTFGPEYENVEADYYRALVETPFKAELEKRFGKQLFHIAESKVKTISEVVMDLLAEENRLTSNYQKLIANAKVLFEGEEKSLAQIDKYIISNSSRTVRKQATEAKYEFFSKNQEEFDKLFDDLVKVRTRIAKELGFSNFTELAYLRWNRSDWDAEAARVFRENVLTHIVPLASKIVENHGKRIGVENVKIYDEKVQFLEGNPIPKGDPEWIIEQGRKLYSELSLETKRFYDEMTERELFDLVHKPGKAYTGYCTFLWKQKAPYVFANFNGTSNDIRVLVHEVGHAFQAYNALQVQEQPEYFFPTMEASEIFSMSMEFFVYPWLDYFFKEDAEKHKFVHLADSIVKMPRLCAGDEFQHEVYANPDLTPEERRQLWSEIEKKYLPYRDHDGIPYLVEGGIWQEVIHIYEVPFYLLDYVLAQVCALEFWRMSNENFEKAWETYVRLCKIGGSKSFLELLKEGNLQSPFEEKTFVALEKFVGSQLEKMEQSL